MASALVLKELCVVKADIDAAKALIEESKATGNKNLQCFAGFHCAQAVEQSIKDFIYLKRPDIYNELNHDGARSIRKTHDIRELLFKAEECSKGFIERHAYISENADNFKVFRLLRFGNASITHDDLDDILKALNGLVSELENEIHLTFPDEKVNAELIKGAIKSTEKLELIISNKQPYISEDTGRGLRKNLNRKDFGLVTSHLKASEILLKEGKKTNDPYKLGLAIYHSGQVIEIASKAFIKENLPEMFNKRDENGRFLIKYSSDIGYLLKKIDQTIPGVFHRNPFLKDNADTFRDIYKLHYGQTIITETDAEAMFSSVKEVVNRLGNDFTAIYSDPKLVQKFYDREWGNRTPIYLNDPGKQKAHTGSTNKISVPEK